MSNSLRPHGLQHARLPCPSLSPRVCSNSHPLSQWCHQTISSPVIPFSSCPQFFPASGSFPSSWLFTPGRPSIGASASVKLQYLMLQLLPYKNNNSGHNNKACQRVSLRKIQTRGFHKLQIKDFSVWTCPVNYIQTMTLLLKRKEINIKAVATFTVRQKKENIKNRACQTHSSNTSTKGATQSLYTYTITHQIPLLPVEFSTPRTHIFKSQTPSSSDVALLAEGSLQINKRMRSSWSRVSLQPVWWRACQRGTRDTHALRERPPCDAEGRGHSDASRSQETPTLPPGCTRCQREARNTRNQRCPHLNCGLLSSEVWENRRLLFQPPQASAFC